MIQYEACVMCQAPAIAEPHATWSAEKTAHLFLMVPLEDSPHLPGNPTTCPRPPRSTAIPHSTLRGNHVL